MKVIPFAFYVAVGLFGTGFSIQNYVVAPYVERNINQIVQEQEQKLKFKHIGVPNFKFPVFDSKETAPFPLISRRANAEYFEKTDTVEIYLTAERIYDLIVGLEFGRLKKTVKHELGHYWMDKLSEKMGFGGWIVENEDRFPVILGRKLASEGVGEYFGRTRNENESNPLVWEGSPNRFLDGSLTSKEESQFIYNGGYWLVKPILDQFGVEKGARYLINNPLVVNDLSDVPKYQKKALEDLTRQSLSE